MITIFNPDTDTFVAVDTANIADPVLNLNLLIEMRVISGILREMNKDIITDTVESLRADAASDTPNPVTGI